MPLIYLDYNATTPVDPAVFEAMLPFLGHAEGVWKSRFGNPSSTHAVGRSAAEAMNGARRELADALGANEDEIVFTGGGTESNNLAIKGVFLDQLPVRGHLVISTLEHPATTEPAGFLERLGCTVTRVACSADGVVDPEAIRRAMRSDTRLISIMHANNEIGTIQPIEEISRVCRERGVLLHTDAAQSFGKIPTQVQTLDVDLLSIAGHKVYAPKGVGALYVRRGVRLEPVVHGAGHERGLRAGTENVAYLVGLATAARLAQQTLEETAERTAGLRDQLLQILRNELGDRLRVHGERARRLPNTLSINFPGVHGSQLLEKASRVCASTGSACHSGTTRLSSTLAALGLEAEQAAGTVRLSLGRYTTADEVQQAAAALLEAFEA